MFRLVAKLPLDRRLAGEFRLHNPAGNVVLVGECLGKADNIRATQEGNPSRDPVQPYGDTPLGTYAPAKVERLEPRHPRLGSIVIALNGADGDALRARLCGRTGLNVHGGRGDDRLVPTFGCLRFRDRDLAVLAEVIDGDLVEIVIEADSSGEDARS